MNKKFQSKHLSPEAELWESSPLKIKIKNKVQRKYKSFLYYSKGF